MAIKLHQSIIFGVGIFVLAGLAASAQTTLNPGQDKPTDPGNLAVGAGATVVTTTGPQNFSVTSMSDNSQFSGVYDVTVYADPSNVYCGGCYDFVISVSSNTSSSDAIQHVTDGSFNPSEVTVGWSAPSGGTNCSTLPSTPTPTNCYQTPNEVSRTTTGKTVAFDFNGTANLLGGQSTPTLVIETSAKSYTPGSLVISDDIGSTFSGYGDVPEPVSMGLLGGGLALLGVMRWRNATKS
jgi:hypothetical protein